MALGKLHKLYQHLCLHPPNEDDNVYPQASFRKSIHLLHAKVFTHIENQTSPWQIATAVHKAGDGLGGELTLPPEKKGRRAKQRFLVGRKSTWVASALCSWVHVMCSKVITLLCGADKTHVACGHNFIFKEFCPKRYLQWRL